MRIDQRLNDEYNPFLSFFLFLSFSLTRDMIFYEIKIICFGFITRDLSVRKAGIDDCMFNSSHARSPVICHSLAAIL